MASCGIYKTFATSRDCRFTVHYLNQIHQSFPCRSLAILSPIEFLKKIEGDEEKAVADFNSPDFLLDTVVGIHELHSLDEIPSTLQEYELNDYYTISILYVDDTGKYQYEDTCSYLVVAAEESYYLLEIGMYSQIEDAIQDGKISSDDNVFVYEINEDDYEKMSALFVNQ